MDLILNLFMQEDAYVEFLRLRRVPLEERHYSLDALDIIPLASILSLSKLHLFLLFIVNGDSSIYGIVAISF